MGAGLTINGIDLGTLVISFNPDTKRLSKALFTEDDIGAVLRCHFEAERATVHALSLIDQNPPSKRSLQYLSQQLSRLEALGAPAPYLKPLRILNSHRNSFAHRGQEVLTEKQATELREAIGEVLPALKTGGSLRVHGARPFNKTYDEATTKERYVMSTASALFLVAALPDIARVVAKGEAHVVSPTASDSSLDRA